MKPFTSTGFSLILAWALLMGFCAKLQAASVLQAQNAQYAVKVPASVFSQKEKLALSMWIRWKQDGSISYAPLFGQAGNPPGTFQLGRYGPDRFTFTIVVDDQGEPAQKQLIGTTSPQDQWIHVFAEYDSEADEGSENLRLYINAIRVAGEKLKSRQGRTRGMPLRTLAEPVDLALVLDSATQWNVGETAMWTGMTVPSLEMMRSYVSGSIAMRELPQPQLHWDMGGEATRLSESCQKADLELQQGRGELVDAAFGIEPVLHCAEQYIGHTGEILRTRWTPLSGEKAISVTAGKSRPVLSLTSDGTSRSVTLQHYARWGDVIMWVIPEELRPVTGQEVYHVRFPRDTVGLLTDSLQFNTQQDIASVENRKGVPLYPLPKGPRKPLGVVMPGFKYYTNGVIACDLSQVGLLWNRVVAYDGRGVPIQGNAPKDKVFAYLFQGWAKKPEENIILFWRDAESGTASIRIEGGCTPLGERKKVALGGREYWSQVYGYSGNGAATIVLATDGEAKTHLGDFKVALESTLPELLDGKFLSESFKRRHEPYSYGRHLDTMHINDSNVVTSKHFTPADHSVQGFPVDLRSDIVSIEPFTGRQNYFDVTGGTCFAVTLKGENPFHTGQKVKIKGTEARWWQEQSEATLNSIGPKTVFSCRKPGLFASGDAVQITAEKMPEGLKAGCTYYLQKTSGREFTLHPTLDDAKGGSRPLVLSSDGSGLLLLHKQSDLNAQENFDIYTDADLVATQGATPQGTQRLLAWVKGRGYIEQGNGGEMSCGIKGGISAEAMARMHNEMYAYSQGRMKIAWVNRPHAATDEAFRDFLQRLHKNLDPQVEVWLEYSNEVWNLRSPFTGQTRYATNRGRQMGMGIDEYYAYVSYRHLPLMREVFGKERPYRVVIAGMAMVPTMLERRMKALREIHQKDTDANRKSWEDLPIVMTVANYHNFLDMDPEQHQCNRDAVLKLSPAGILELATATFRHLPEYRGIRESYGKQLCAYEGGFAFVLAGHQAPDYTAVQRRIFAANLHPLAANLYWENYRRFTELYGFDSTCSLGEMGFWDAPKGKTWVTYSYPGQMAGVGDGSDGRFNNVEHLEQYIKNGETDPVYTQFVSVRGYAQRAWVGLPLLKDATRP